MAVYGMYGPYNRPSVKVYSPEESGCIVDHENVNLSSGNHETRSSKLMDEDAKYRVEFERSYNYLRPASACSKIYQN